jgi:YihY family inner membrane protein
MDPRAILARILEQPLVVAVRAPLDVYGRAAGGLLAQGLAFSALFAILPTLLLVLGLIGWVAGDPAARDRIIATLVAAFPPMAELARDSVNALSDGAALTSILGAIGVVWTVSQFYGVLDVAMARIFSDVPERSGLHRTTRGFIAVALMVALIGGLVVLSSAILALDATSATHAAPVEVIAALLDSPPVLVVLAGLLVLVIYRRVPPKTPSLQAAGIPAAVVGAFIVVLSRAFVFLVPRLVGVEALAGSLASAFVTLAWLSLNFQALLLGAAWVRVRNESPRDLPSAGSAALEGAAPPAEPGVRGE